MRVCGVSRRRECIVVNAVLTNTVLSKNSSVEKGVPEDTV